MKRLMENTVLVGLVMDWFLATRPTSLSPVLEKPTTEGVVRAPSALAITWGSPPSMMAMQELVVPRSMPRTLFVAMFSSLISFHRRAFGPRSLSVVLRHLHQRRPQDPL